MVVMAARGFEPGCMWFRMKPSTNEVDFLFRINVTYIIKELKKKKGNLGKM